MITIFAQRWFKQDLPAVCARVAAAGFDGIDLAVRDAAWVRPGDLDIGGRAFLATARSAGLAVPLAIIDPGIEALLRDDAPLRRLADLGIPRVRIGYLSAGADPGAALVAGRAAAARLAGTARRIGIQVVYQVHHGTLVSSPTAAWFLAGDADPAGFAIQLDLGNQVHEGYEAWNKAAALLGTRLVSVGVKDAVRPGGAFVPLGTGLADMRACRAALRGRDVLWDFQPFHDRDDLIAGERSRFAEEMT
jgi:sugar phosphate isomerase/epimerase